MEIKKVPLLDLTRQYKSLKKEMDESIFRVIESQKFILGEDVALFEKEVSAYLGVESISCASGSDALLLALMALDIGPGDEVITTPYTFFASVSSIVRVGARAVMVDVNPDTFNIDLEKMMDRVNPRTKAVIPVHLFGLMAPLEKVKMELKDKSVAIIEDACQAFGASRMVGESNLMRAGAVGDIGTFSFFPSKNLGCYGDGGMLTAHDNALAQRLKSLRVHGGSKTYYHDEVGINSRLDSIQASVLRVKMPHIEEWNEARRHKASLYMQLFAEAGLLEFITPQKEEAFSRHIYHQYVAKVEDRDELKAHLDKNGIGNAIYYPLPLHMQRCFGGLGYKKGDMPEAEKLADTTIALPIFPELTDDEQEYIVDNMKVFYRR